MLMYRMGRYHAQTPSDGRHENGGVHGKLVHEQHRAWRSRNAECSQNVICASMLQPVVCVSKACQVSRDGAQLATFHCTWH